jgi:hypothetical protein
MKPRYRYFWDYGQCGELLKQCNCEVCIGFRSFSLVNDPEVILMIRNEREGFDYQPPRPDSFFAYEERPRQH